MPIRLPIQAQADEKSFSRAADKAQKAFADAGKDAGKKFSDSISEGARDSTDALRKMANKAQDAYDKMRDAAGKVRIAEERLDEARQSGNSAKIITQAERLQKARRDEAKATRKASDSYKEYDEAAKGAADAGSKTVKNFMKALGTDVSGIAGTKGKAIADSLSGGFASSSKLAALGSMSGPIGMALAGVSAIGVMAGKQLVSAIGDGMQIVASEDYFKARMGFDDATMRKFAESAGAAYAAGFGDSMSANLSTATVAIHSGLLDPNATGKQAQDVIEKLHGIADVFDIDVKQAARSAGQLMRTGFARDATQAFDIIAKGEQEGLDAAGDFMSTLRQFSTSFKRMGLSASDVLTLLNQGMKGGARNASIVARTVREFSAKAVNGSKSTKEAFEALGFNAEDMTKRVAAGGQTARDAFAASLTALQNLNDPMQQALVFCDLFGGQWKRIGDAINALDLSEAAGKVGDFTGTTDRAINESGDNAMSKWDEAQRSISQSFEDLKVSAATAFEPIGNWLADLANRAAGLFDRLLKLGHSPPTPIPPKGFNGGVGVLLDPDQDGQLPGPAPSIPGPTTQPRPWGPVPAPSSGGQALFPPGIPAGAPDQNAAAPPPPVPGTPKPIGSDDDKDKSGGGKSGGKSGGGKSGGGGASSPHFTNVAPTADFLAAGMGGQARLLAEAQMTSAREELEAAQRRLHQVQADNNAKAEDVQAAKDDVLKKQKAYLRAEKQLAAAQGKAADAAQKSTKTLSDGMQQIGAKLDQDFGISKGLPGIAENLTKFLANLAMAPALGALSAVTKAFPGNGGKGIAGMIGTAAGMGSSGGGAGGMVGGGGGLSALSAGLGGRGRGMSMGGGRTGAGVSMPGGSPSGWGKQDIANYIYSAAMARGYSPHDATSILAYAIGESGLNPSISGGVQGDDEVIGLFQQKSAFARGGGISPSMRTDPRANTQAYLNQLEKHRGLPIEKALPATSVGGPLSGVGAQPWGPLMNQARGYVGGAGGAAGPGNAPMINPSAWQPGVGAGGGTLGGPGGIGDPLTGLTADNADYRIGGMAPATPVQGSGLSVGGGGLIGLAEQGGLSAIQAGASGATSAASPGSGAVAGVAAAFATQAAQIGIDEANRAIAQAGRVAGIGVEGVMETVLPHGSKLADPNNSWVGRIASGVAGAKPQLPNVAGGGKKGGKDDEKSDPKSTDRAEDAKSAKKSPPKKSDEAETPEGGSGTTINNTVNIEGRANDTEDRQGADLTNHLSASYSAPGPG